MPPKPSSHAPLESSYPAKVAMVLLALCPFIVVTTAATLFEKSAVRDLHTSRTALEMAAGTANAGYAFGAVFAAMLAKKFGVRQLLLCYQAAFVAGSILVASAPDAAAFTTGRVVQGVATGMMLVAALPSLPTGFSPARMPVTAAVIDLGLFGATTAGPLVGGVVGAHGSWRLLFWILAGVGVLAFGFEVATVSPSDPLKPDATWDVAGIGLAAVATFLPFVGTSLLVSKPFFSWYVLPFVLAGLVALVGMLVLEYRRDDPVTPVRTLSHSFPVNGILVAMFTGAAAVALLQLAEKLALSGMGTGPQLTGELFWPQTVAVLLAAALFGVVFKTRFIPALVLAGTLVLAGAAAGLAAGAAGGGHLLIMLVAAGIGFGAGATVSPGLFLAALSVPSSQLGPAFAQVELLRSEAAFLVAPVLLHVAMAGGDRPAAIGHGVGVAAWAVLGLVVAGLAVTAFLWRASGARAQAPDLHSWLEVGDEGVDSPALLAQLR